MLDRTPGTMQIMDPSGHTELKWNPGVSDEVKTARDMFQSMIDKGYRAFKMTRDGDKGQAITTFDPSAEKLVMIPQLVGG